MINPIRFACSLQDFMARLKSCKLNYNLMTVLWEWKPKPILFVHGWSDGALSHVNMQVHVEAAWLCEARVQYF